MDKTLIGKENYLFLQNDSCNEIKIHNENLCLVSDTFYLKYEKYKDKFFLVLFPDKSFLYNQFLPHGYNMKYRPGFEKYKSFLENHLLDGYIFLKNEDDVYYKTDTHINLKGNYIIYENFITKINELFNLNLKKKEISIEQKIYKIGLSKSGIGGIGDLTWQSNLGNQILTDLTDTYYFSNELNNIYTTYIFKDDSPIRLLNRKLIDETTNNINKVLDWIIISKCVLYQKNNLNNDKKIKVLIFYDSFLLNILSLYLELFDEVYMSKSLFDNNLVNLISPDFIFEFRCERFLS